MVCDVGLDWIGCVRYWRLDWSLGWDLVRVACRPGCRLLVGWDHRW